jgi:nucleotidyltransferase/DNA polymerase involved in DNA repair
MHVDMDCFFASVSAARRPELRHVPVAVAHSANAAGHSEISCVNYAARRAGVRADMWMAAAKEKCGLLPRVCACAHSVAPPSRAFAWSSAGALSSRAHGGAGSQCHGLRPP